MECVATLSNPELLAGFQELVGDSDVAVVKRTIRVFSNVYHNAFRLLSSDELEEEILLKAWAPIKEVVDQLLSMISTCENEGVLVHIVRFLESSLTAHLMYDLTQKIQVAERGRDVVKRGLKALKDLVTTPYVGGCVFIVAVRALINIACLRPDLYEPVIDLVGRQMNMLPPTLFDHNVRSFHKVLQGNLFKLMKKVEDIRLKEKLTEMMVKTGVPRKAIAPWLPPFEAGKRSPEDLDAPPVKRAKGERDETPPPAGSLKDMSAEQIVRASSDPRLINRSPNFQKDNQPRRSPPPKEFSDEQREMALSQSLTLSNICTLIFSSLENLPKALPEHFVKELDEKRLVHDDLGLMKNRLVSLMYDLLSKEELNDLINFQHSNSIPKKSIEGASVKDLSMLECQIKDKAPSPVVSTNISPSCTPPPPLVSFPPTDTDLRQVYLCPNKPADVDMRILGPKHGFRDPRISRSNTRDSRLAGDPRDPRNSANKINDPRINKSSNFHNLHLRSSPPLRVDPNDNRHLPRDPRIHQIEDSDSKERHSPVNLASEKHQRLPSENHRSKEPRINDASDISHFTKDPRYKAPPKEGLLPLPNMQIHMNNISRNESRDPRVRNIPANGKMIGPSQPLMYSSDGGLSHPIFPNNNQPMMPNLPPHPLQLPNCSPGPNLPMQWQGNFQPRPRDSSAILLAQAVVSTQGFIPSPMLHNM